MDYEVLDFRKNMVNFILSKMDGSNELDKTIKSKPSKKFILGPLAAKRPVDINDDISNNDEYDQKASIRANRFRVSILVKNGELEKEHKISVLVSGYIFYKVHSEDDNNEAEVGEDIDNNLDSSAKKFIWKRQIFEMPVEFNVNRNIKEFSADIDFTKTINSCNADKDIYIKISPDTWKAEIKIVIDKYDSSSSILHFYLSNMNYESKKEFNFEKTLFNCKLQVDLHNIKTTEFIDEYNYNGHRQRYFYDFRTVNCQAKFINLSQKSQFEIANYYLFEENEITTLSGEDNYDLSFKSLSESDWASQLKIVQSKMERLYDKYKSKASEDINEFMPRQVNRQFQASELKSIISNFQELMKSYENGLNSILSNDNAKIAFINMNTVFYNYYKNKLGVKFNENDPPSWRVFQIVFIVSAIRSIVNDEDRDVVDVLHVATGGGKSEAYFGLIVFSMFYERLNGKKDGVTALVKFPLRMLSIQQLQRLANVIIYAESVRKAKYDLFQGEEFSLGYYVGNSEDFPSLYSDIKKELYTDSKFNKLKKYPIYSKVLSYCPLCNYDNRGKILIIDQPTEKRLLHQCELNPRHSFHIYYSDREVFKFRPTVVVSTVDKWAGLAQQRRARALLGSNGSMCPDGHGFIPSGDQCENNNLEGICKNIGKNSPASSGPILSIQDEIHLLSESFGTISSHFEGLIEEIVAYNSNGRKLKHIAMSATLNGIQSQIREIYKKDSFVISGESSIIENPAFELFFKKRENVRRLIYGMVPNIRDNHYATLRTILHAIEFVDMEQRSFSRDPNSWIKKYGMRNNEEAIQTFKDFLTILTYHLKKQDAEDMDRFSGAVINDILEKNYNITTKGIVLTGDRGMDELKNAIDTIQKNSDNYNLQDHILNNARYEPIFATSVVSHGLDIEELNFMVFQGIPYTTSEYIQALSRVGRHHEGIVMVWLYPTRVRDNSFFKNFGRYNELLDHEVLPAPIKRNSPLGAKQTINSLFCAGVIQFLSSKYGKPLIYKQDIEKLNKSDITELIQFIKSAYGGNINLNIEAEVESRINQIRRSSNRSNEFFPKVLLDSGDYFFRNQIGMRGIQGQLKITPTGYTRSKFKQLIGEN